MVLGRRGDGHLHAVERFYFVRTNFRESNVLRESIVEVALGVDRTLRDTAEVADTCESDVCELRQEVPHALTAKRRHHADDLALADLETGD